jgi:hypothetical protein
MDGIVFLSSIFAGKLENDPGTTRMFGKKVCDLEVVSIKRTNFTQKINAEGDVHRTLFHTKSPNNCRGYYVSRLSITMTWLADMFDQLTENRQGTLDGCIIRRMYLLQRQIPSPS